MDFQIEYTIKEKGKTYTARSVNWDTDGQLSFEEMVKYLRNSLVAISLDVLKEEQDKGFDKDPVVVVDGRPNKPVTSVNPFGKIQFFARIENMTAGLREIYVGILERSKIDTGLYKESNAVFHNGKLVAMSLPEFDVWAKTAQIKAMDIVRYVNLTPYARKLERFGVTAQRSRARQVKSKDKKLRSGPMILAPNGTYFLTMRSLSRKYKYLASAKFEFISGGTLGLGSGTTPSKAGKPLRRTYVKDGRPYLYPSITIKLMESGMA